jgi:hypothetical protein
LLFCFSRLGRHVCGDHQNLVVWDLKHFTCIVQGNGRTGDLKCEEVRRRLTVDLAEMSHEERSSKLLEYTALASRVFRFLMVWTRVVEVTPVAPAV